MCWVNLLLIFCVRYINIFYIFKLYMRICIHTCLCLRGFYVEFLRTFLSIHVKYAVHACFHTTRDRPHLLLSQTLRKKYFAHFYFIANIRLCPSVECMHFVHRTIWCFFFFIFRSMQCKHTRIVSWYRKWDLTTSLLAMVHFDFDHVNFLFLNFQSCIII